MYVSLACNTHGQEGMRQLVLDGNTCLQSASEILASCLQSCSSVSLHVIGGVDKLRTEHVGTVTVEACLAQGLAVRLLLAQVI